MLIMNASKFNSFAEKNEDIVAASLVTVLTNNSNLQDELQDANFAPTLAPDPDLVASFVSGDISRKQFKKIYTQYLKAYENQFLIYTIARAFNKKKYLPIFVTSDAEAETGFLDILAGHIKKKYGMKLMKVKKLRSEAKGIRKSLKKEKKSKRHKMFMKAMRDIVRDSCQLSLEGLEYLEKQESKFAIDRVMIFFKQSGASDEISRKEMEQAVTRFADSSKHAKKMIKYYVKELGMSKKPDYWSRKQLVNLISSVYDEIHGGASEQ